MKTAAVECRDCTNEVSVAAQENINQSRKNVVLALGVDRGFAVQEFGLLEKMGPLEIPRVAVKLQMQGMTLRVWQTPGTLPKLGVCQVLGCRF